MVQTVDERMREAAELFRDRNAIYGANYLRFGELMNALLPMGVNIVPGDIASLGRLVLLSHIVTKVGRYCSNFNRGGHPDSLTDLSVYAAMLAEHDEIWAKKLVPPYPAPAVEDPPETQRSDEWENTRGAP